MSSGIGTQVGSFIDNNTGQVFLAVGNSGEISIDTTTLTLENGANIDASTQGIGNAGMIFIIASEGIVLKGENSFSNKTSNISSLIDLRANGASAGVIIDTTNLTLENGASINSSTYGVGNAGVIDIRGKNGVTLVGESSLGSRSNIVSAISNTAIGNSNGITINSGNLRLEDGAFINTSTSGQGDAGLIKITSTDEVILTGKSTQGFISFIASEVSSGENNSNGIIINTPNLTLENGALINTSTFAEGKAGNITLDTNKLSMFEGARVEALTQGAGDAGNITINSGSSIELGKDSKINVETSSSGKPGEININTPLLNIGENAQLSATATATATNLQGGGSINLKVDNLNVSGRLGIFAETQGETPAGNLTINPYQNNPNLDIAFINEGFISASTTATGDGGSITIQAPENLDISGNGKIFTETSGRGNAGNILLDSNNISISEGVEISASTSNQGNSGNITLDMTNLTLNNATIQALTTGEGNPGSILISNGDNNAENVSLSNSSISTEIQAEGNNTTATPANITIDTDNLNLDNSTITASTNSNRDAGNISIDNAENINLVNQSQINALTTGSGNAGNLNLNIAEEIKIDRGSILNVETQGEGDAGNIDINANIISIGDNAELSARTREQAEGKAGNISLNVNEMNISGELGIFAETQGIGEGGNLIINSRNNPTIDINLNNEGQISASTSGSGDGGDITINAPDTMNINGEGIIKVETSGSGNAGIINIQTQNLNLTDGIEISASTTGSGNAGNINLFGKVVNLNEATVNAFTDGKGNAGSINIANGLTNASDINLTNSTISTEIRSQGEATQRSNITLNSDNLTLRDSTVTASTLGKGNAGNINIVKNNNIDLTNSTISASTSGMGDTGEINLTASEKIDLVNSQINSSVETGGEGNSLTVNFSTPQLSLDNSQINAFTDGKGNAGSINISQQGNNSNLVSLTNKSEISTEIGENGEANQPSNITINTNQLESEEGEFLKYIGVAE